MAIFPQHGPPPVSMHEEETRKAARALGALGS
jgi:hypothetical protein